jgi:hypothetical protein
LCGNFKFYRVGNEDFPVLFVGVCGEGIFFPLFNSPSEFAVFFQLFISTVGIFFGVNQKEKSFPCAFFY